MFGSGGTINQEKNVCELKSKWWEDMNLPPSRVLLVDIGGTGLENPGIYPINFFLSNKISRKICLFFCKYQIISLSMYVFE